MMRLTTIGTGTAAPSPSRVNAAHLIETHDARILLDCGSGVVHRMAELGVDWINITHLLVSHFHADHISDIPTLLFAWRYGIVPPRTTPVTIVGPPGIKEIIDKLDVAMGGSFSTLGFSIEVLEQVDGAQLKIGATTDVAVKSVPHSRSSVGYAVTVGNRRVVYTGDTSFDADLGRWAVGCDILLAECSLPASMALPTHLTPEECGQLAAIAQPDLLLLTHFYPPVERLDIASIVAENFAGRVVLAHDGWTTELEE